MYAQVHTQVIGNRFNAQATNDAALVSTALLLCAELDASPPDSRAAVLARIKGILGDTYGARAIERAIG